MIIHITSRLGTKRSYNVTDRRITERDRRNKLMTPIKGGEPWFVKGPITRKALNLAPALKLEIEENGIITEIKN